MYVLGPLSSRVLLVVTIPIGSGRQIGGLKNYLNEFFGSKQGDGNFGAIVGWKCTYWVHSFKVLWRLNAKIRG